jgi:MYXO-CTERM domain-containing protein
MNRTIAALVAVVGACGAAGAEMNTRIDVLVSRDGVNFAPTIFALPGETLQVLISVSYIGTASPLGLASMVFQPTVSDFAASALGFVNGGAGSNTSTPSGVISDSAGSYGRISPWGRTAMTTSTAITNFDDNSVGQPAGTWLRIAQRQVTAWIGGPGNTSGGSGVNIAQLSNVGRTASDPAFNPQLTNIHVFRFGITVDPFTTLGDMTIDLPLNGFGNRNSTTGEREIYWWGDMNEASGSIRGTAIVFPAHTSPSPGPLWALGVAGLAGTRRRRAR